MQTIERNVSRDLDELIKFLEEESKRDFRKFLVHLSTEFMYENRNAGSRITGWVDRNLHTLEEQRNEHIRLEEGFEGPIKRKRLFVFMGKKHYDVRVDPGGNFNQKYCYSFRRARDYVSESAHFLLMRYLALTKFIGDFELAAIHIDGGLCRNIYHCEGPTGGYINNERMDLYKVYRTVIEECGITQRSCTVLDLDGHLMKHDWENNKYVLQINPLSSPLIKKPTLMIHFSEMWKHDVQLLSKFLDKKVVSTFQMKSYLQDHREISNLINDYLQNILQIKPENIIEFTKHFFMSYAPYLLPHIEYFEKDVNNMFAETKDEE